MLDIVVFYLFVCLKMDGLRILLIPGKRHKSLWIFFSGQARDVGETVEVFQDAAFQPFLHPAAFDLWHLLLHRVFQHSL